MTHPPQPVEPWLADPAPGVPTDGAGSVTAAATARRGVSSRTPFLIGVVTFVVALVALSALAAVGVGVLDKVARNEEMRVLVSRIQTSEDAMSQVQAQEAAAVESYQAGTLSTEDLQAELTRIAADGVQSISAAGDAVASVEWLRWHTDIETAQQAYLAHNQAWVDYLTRAAADPAEFGQPQEQVNQTFEAAQQPLLDAVPPWDLFELRSTLTAMFADQGGDSGGAGDQV